MGKKFNRLWIQFTLNLPPFKESEGMQNVAGALRR